MPRIVIGGAGAIGASIAYHLAVAGADDVVLVDRETVGSGATSKAMGGVRQQFSTAAEVRLAQESIRFFEELGPPFFDQVGYLFLATTEAGLTELEARRELQVGLGVPVQRLGPDEIAAGCTGGDRRRRRRRRRSAPRTESPTHRPSRGSSSGAPSSSASTCSSEPPSTRSRPTWPSSHVGPHSGQAAKRLRRRDSDQAAPTPADRDEPRAGAFGEASDGRGDRDGFPLPAAGRSTDPRHGGRTTALG